MQTDSTSMRRVGFSLGSNVGDRLSTLELVCDYLSDLFGALRLSQVYETEPINCPEGSPSYLNACIEVETDMPAEEILENCLQIERELGRQRSGTYGEPRTCDIDLLYCGNETCHTDTLILPHPRAHLRAFVLRPLCDIDPLLILPGQSENVRQLLEKQADMQGIKSYSL